MSLVTSPSRLASPSLTTKEKKKAAKLEISAHVKQIAESVKVLTYFFGLLRDKQIKRGQQWEVKLENGAIAKISHKDLTDHQKATISAIKGLPKMVLDKMKSRRGTGGARNSGFNKIVQLNDEMVNFFGRVNLGPLATADVVETVRADGKKKIEAKKVQAIAGSDLRTALVSFQPRLANGQENPVFRVMTQGSFPAIHAAYVYNNGMAIPGESNRGYLRVSDDMRRGLRQTLAETILGDVQKVSVKYAKDPRLAQYQAQANQIGAYLISTLDNAPQPGDMDAQKVHKVGDVVIFNPNYYKYAHASKIITRGGQALTAPELTGVDAAVQSVYGKNLQGVLSAQHLEAYKAGGIAREARKKTDGSRKKKKTA